MAGKNCAICGKTAYPVESLKDGDRTWHKICFRCSVCKGTLSVKNFKLKDGALYCGTHYPTENATTIADDVVTRHAVNAPQKKAEGLATVHRGDVRGKRDSGVAREQHSEGIFSSSGQEDGY